MDAICLPRLARGLCIAAAGAFVAACATVPPPTEQLAVSKAAVSEATRAGAYDYAAAEMRSANDKLERANAAMRNEDYVRARRLAEEAEADARLAATTARSVKSQ